MITSVKKVLSILYMVIKNANTVYELKKSEENGTLIKKIK